MVSPAAPGKRHLPWAPIMTVCVILGVLVWLSIPEVKMGVPVGERALQTVNNGRQIYLAAFNMAEDGLAEKDPRRGWPGDLAHSDTEPVNSLTAYAERLVKNNYLKREDLAKVFAAPGVPRYPGHGTFLSEYSPFKIYLVTAEDDAHTLFLASKNLTFGRGLDSQVKPFGAKEFVIVRKGGDALHLPNSVASNRSVIGFMPGHSSPEDPGEETSANVWKD